MIKICGTDLGVLDFSHVPPVGFEEGVAVALCVLQVPRHYEVGHFPFGVWGEGEHGWF